MVVETIPDPWTYYTHIYLTAQTWNENLHHYQKPVNMSGVGQYVIFSENILKKKKKEINLYVDLT